MSNKKYRWHSSEGSCEKCQALNNTEYSSESEIPDKPHPHCKCYIVVVEDDADKCECIEDALEEMDEVIGDAEVLKVDVQEEIAYFTSVIVKYNNNIVLIAALENCIDGLQQIVGTIGDFIRNYREMREANTIGADKYFHSKANCDAAQRGKIGELVAKGISDLREFTDLFKNVLVKGMSIAESLEDSAGDQEANEYGREQGKKHPDEESGVLVDIYRPEGLPDRY